MNASLKSACVTERKAFLTGNEGELIHVCGGCKVLPCTTRLCTS